MWGMAMVGSAIRHARIKMRFLSDFGAGGRERMAGRRPPADRWRKGYNRARVAARLYALPRQATQMLHSSAVSGGHGSVCVV